MTTLRPLVVIAALATLACTPDPEDTEVDTDPPSETDDSDAIVDSSCEVCHSSEDALKANLPEDTDGEPVDEGES